MKRPLPLLLILSATACARFVGGPQAGPTATPVTETSPAVFEDARFVPASYLEGTSRIMPLTFPDGSTAELVVPNDLDLMSVGVWPEVVISSGGNSKEFFIEHRSVEQIVSAAQAPELLTEYDDGHSGKVGFWDLDGDNGHYLNYLLVQIGNWSAYIWDYDRRTSANIVRGERMTDEDQALWARNLRGYETTGGFLVLDPVPPLEMEGSSSIWGPRLRLEGPTGGAYLFPGTCELDPYDQLKPGDIQQVNGLEVARRDGASGAGWCVPGAPMKVEVFGPPRFVDAAVHGLGIRNVRLVP